MSKNTPEEEAIIKAALEELKEGISKINGTYHTSRDDYNRLVSKLFNYDDSKIRHGIVKNLAIQLKRFDDQLYNKAIHFFIVLCELDSDHEITARAAAALGINAKVIIAKSKQVYSEEDLKGVVVDEATYRKIIAVIADGVGKCEGERTKLTPALQVLIAESLVKLKAIPLLEELAAARKVNENIISKIIEYLVHNISNGSEFISGWSIFKKVSDALLDESLTKYTNRIIWHLSYQPNSTELIEKLKEAELDSITHIVNHTRDGTLNPDHIKKYAILEENSHFLGCGSKHLNFNLFNIAAIYGNNDTLAVLIDHCKHDKYYEIDHLSTRDYMKAFDTCDNFAKYCRPNYSFTKPEGWKSLICSKSTFHTVFWINNICYPYAEYHSIDSSNPENFSSVKQIIKYQMDHKNTYARANACRSDSDKKIASINFPVYNDEHFADSPDKINIALCASVVVGESPSHNADL